MKKSNLFIKSALAMALASTYSLANAAAMTAANVDYALETCQATTVFTLGDQTYTVGAGGAATQDFYVTFTLTNGTFTATPVATVVAAATVPPAMGETATYIAGGVGTSNVTYRINGSSVAIDAGDTVVLTAPTVTATSCASAVTISAANGLLFLGTPAAVASPVEAAAAATNAATFTQAVTITMAETGTEPIDLNPTPTTNSRLVFGPVAALDGITGTSPAEAFNMAARQLVIGIGAQMEPNNSAAFADVIDDLVVSLGAPFDVTSISATAGQGLCLDDLADGACGAGETFDLTTGVATIVGGSWATNGGFLLFNDGTAFAPRTLTLNYSLAVKANAVRPGMTAHTYSYTAPANNAWTFAYANGTLLRSQWFVSDAANSSTMRLVNAGSVDALVVDAKYYLDSGVTNSLVGLTTIPANSGKNLQINATSVPDLAAGTASRGYIEVVIAGDLTNVDGSMITFGNTSGDRTIGVMRNVTFDTGVRGLNTSNF